MKKIVFVLVLLFLCNAAFSQVYSIQSHEIEITVKESGETSVEEKYYLEFSDNFQLQQFREKSEKLGIDLIKWKEFDPNIKIHIGSEKDVYNGVLSFVEGERNLIQLNYDLADPIVVKAGETSRIINFELKKNALKEFKSGDLTVIPDGTTIRIVLPRSAEIDPEIQPAAKLQKNIVVWSGYTKSNSVQLSYRLFKEIAPKFELAVVLRQVFSSKAFPIFAAIVILLSVAIYVNRKSISNGIENYIVGHSNLEEDEFEEEEKGT